jgi:hypothetical protein
MIIGKCVLVNKPENLRGHVVILGAGASVQALPQGDVNGRKLPTMNNFVEVLNLETVLMQAGIEFQGRNFETIYSELYMKNPESDFLKRIEEAVYSYFNNLELPEKPTLYDHLLLSLRPKDLIATFNWDPFLFDAWERNSLIAPLPQIAYLHGNVRIGYCLDDNCHEIVHRFYCHDIVHKRSLIIE